MQQQEPPVAMFPAPGRPSFRSLLPHPRLRWRTAGIAATAAVVATAVVMVASAERDVYLRTHPLVPNLVGKTVAEAARMMVPLRFGVIIAGSKQDPSAPVGIVLMQNPAPGHRLPAGAVIQLRVSQGSGVVPHLRGGPVHEAAGRLESVGLRLGRVQGIDDDSPPGTVLEQFTAPGDRLKANSAVDVLVSQRPGEAAMAPPSEAAPPGEPSPPSTVRPPSRVQPPAVPSMATRTAAPMSAPVVLTPDPRKAGTPQRQEGGPSVGSVTTDCATHAERERVEVCHQSANDGGAEPDLHRSEHRDVPSGP